MGKKLVIVESPAKAKTINKILGADFVVKASVGHIRDLPVSVLGVDVENGFKPKYVMVKGKQGIVADLAKAAKASDSVYLAPDPDREGEAIAWHLQQVLEARDSAKPFFRVQYNEITPRAVREAFEHPGQIDQNRVDAQQARRVLDRLVGYMVSPMLWRRIKRGLSAGRVQSVALRLVCEREKEIRAFVAEEYWLLGARARKLVDPLDPFSLRLVRIEAENAEVKTQAQADGIRADLEGRGLRVAGITTREIARRAPPPFITSSLQQAASSVLGYSPKRTMGIAQKLYEGVELGEGPVGLITYMRTDSFNISQEALAACRRFIVEAYGQEYEPEKPNFFRNRGGAQGAHEAIRPTDVDRTPESLAGRMDPVDLKLYTLIWKRFVASQMMPAIIDQRSVDVEAPPPAAGGTLYVFRATSSDVRFPGYMRVSGVEVGKPKEGEEPEERLPPLAQGEALECLDWLSERKETQPPARYSEASLIKALEKNGVGRPSTYAQIISTLHQRLYVEAVKKSIGPTPLGMQVSELLVSTLNELFDVKFTASMEAGLDEIEKGTVKWTAMLTDFYARFQGWMSLIQVPTADPGDAARVLELLGRVQEWAPETKRGKRTFSDQKFVESVRKQVETRGATMSQRQMDALLRIASRYSKQVPEIETALKAMGHDRVLQDGAPQAADASTVRKFELLRGVELGASVREFVASLQSQSEAGRRLSPAQLLALDRVVMRQSKNIANFDGMKAELAMEKTEEQPDADESRCLLDSLAAVREWKPAVTRGRRVLDDQKFHASLSEHFGRKGYLSFKQNAALKRLVQRYRDQVPDFESLAERFGLKDRQAERRGAVDG